MRNTLIDSRVRSLEEMMADLITTVEQTSLEMRADTARLKEEMSTFKYRMDTVVTKTREDTADFKDATRASIDRKEKDTARFKEEAGASLERMEKSTAKLKEDTDREHRNLNKQLGEIANKQGRMTEELVAPSICRILREVVDCPPMFACGSLVRLRRTHP